MERNTITLKDLKKMIDFAINLKGENMKVEFLDSRYIYHTFSKSIGIVSGDTIIIGEPEDLYVCPITTVKEE